jgi:hypothetical protein
MKKTLAFILILCSAAMLCLSCGDDPVVPPTPTGGDENPSQTTVNTPTIDESTIKYKESTMVVTFQASCPTGTHLKLLLSKKTNGTEETWLDVKYNTSSRQYFVQLQGLVGGTTYSFCIVGYDSEGKEAKRTAEITFTLPKDPAPDAPSTEHLKAYPPTSRNASDGYIQGAGISKAMEYSTDEGETWKPVEEGGKISNLRPGIVLLRLAETPTTEAGKTASITVPPYKSNTDLDGSEGTSEGLHVRRPSPR